ncbi:MAG: tetratricopeptide repeat protein [Terriglobia bacterium]
MEQKSGLGALNLGLLHEYGKGVPQNFATAEELYRQAAGKGMPHAMYRLGVMYQNGEGVRRDDVAAAKWFYEAAKLGHADAQSELGYMFYNGLGTKQDYQNAFAWYIQAAQAGVVFAESSVASMYERGEGVKQDEAEAVAWFRRAADQNDPFAMTQLAVHFRQGSGVPWSEAEAMQWFRKAADQGYASAETSLGYGYMAGLGQGAGQGQQDYRQAAYWFDLAARQGEGYAQLNLAILYEKGWGVSQDLQKAKGLYLQAARSPIPEVANNAKELVSTGPFAVSGPSTPSASPLSRQRENSSDWVEPVIGIGLVIGGAWALANLLSGPSTSTHDAAPTTGGTAQQSDYKDYVADAIQNNIARKQLRAKLLLRKIVYVVNAMW